MNNAPPSAGNNLPVFLGIISSKNNRLGTVEQKVARIKQEVARFSQEGGGIFSWLCK